MPGGAQYASEVKYAASTALGIVGGVITVTQNQHTVTAEVAPGADDLDTISKTNLDDGDEVVLRTGGGADIITLTHATGNIRCPYGLDVTIDDPSDYAVLRYNGTVWDLIASRVLANTTSQVTIGAGTLLIRRPEHTVSGQGGVDDQLDAVTGGVRGTEVILRFGVGIITIASAIAANSIECPGGKNILLATARDYVKIRHDGASWKVIQACTARGSMGLDGGNVLAGANANVVGRIPVIIRQVVTDTVGDHPVILTYGIRVIDAWVVKTDAAGGAETLTISNAGAAITNAMDVNVAITSEVRATQINDANHEVAAGAELRFTTNAATNSFIAYVLAQLT